MKVNKWKLPLYALVGIALLLGGVIIGESLTSASTFWISSGVYPGAPSYTVWREGSMYFAKDAYGKIGFSGTNASQIIQNPLNLKGKILLKSGLYPLDVPLGIYENTDFGGDGMGSTILQMTRNYDMMIGNAETAFFDVGDYGNITIHDLTLDGNNKAYGGIRMDIGIAANVQIFRTEITRITSAVSGSAGWVLGYENPIGIHISARWGGGLYYNWIHDFDMPASANHNGAGLWITGSPNLDISEKFSVIGNMIQNLHTDTGSDAYLGVILDTGTYGLIVQANSIYNLTGGYSASGIRVGARHHVVQGNTIQLVDGNGILVSGVSSYDTFGHIILGNTIYKASGSGIYVDSVDDTVISSNIVYDNNQNDGGNIPAINIDGNSKNITVIGNRAYDDQVVKTQDYGLAIVSTADFIQVVGNDFDGNSDGSVRITTSGTHLDFNNNKGFVTENSGSSSVTTGATVSHGLAGTPTSVTISAGATGVTDLYVSAFGSSTFTINFGGGGTKTFYWYAEYRP